MPRPPQSRRFGQPRTVALLVDWLEDHYQDAVVAGAVQAAKERNVRLVVVAGGALGSEGPKGRERNYLYELVSRRSCDAAIVMSGTLANEVGTERLVAYLDRFDPLPICSVAVRLPGIPTVVADNDVGVRSAIAHLIEDHGYERIAFIGGPQGNNEALRRLMVYRGVLDAHGVAVEDELIVHSDFQINGGEAAVAELFDRCEKRPQAIVAANDLMALGALNALRQWQLNVPGDVALVGFDDIEDCQYCDPPLTTVRQQLERQGREAVCLVLRKLAGEHVDDVVIPTEMIVRESCGCQKDEPLVFAPRMSRSFELSLLEQRDALAAELHHVARGNLSFLPRDWAEKLLTGLLEQVSSGGTEFDECTATFLGTILTRATEITSWQAVLSTLRGHAVAASGDSLDTLTRVEEVLHSAQLAASRAWDRREAQRRLSAVRSMWSLTKAGADIVRTRERDALWAVLDDLLPRLGLSACFVVRFETTTSGTRQCSLAHVFHESTRARAKLSKHLRRRYDSVELLQAVLVPSLDEAACVVEPLCHAGEPLGFVVVSYKRHNTVFYEVLREQLAARLGMDGQADQVRYLEEACGRWQDEADRRSERIQKLEDELAELRSSSAPARPSEGWLAGQLEQLLTLVSSALEQLDDELSRESSTKSESELPAFTTARAQCRALRVAYEAIENQVRKEAPTVRPDPSVHPD